nr:hypothetical protein [Paenibacillus jilunlii]
MSARYRYNEFGVAKAPEKFDLNWSARTTCSATQAWALIITEAAPMHRRGILTPALGGLSAGIRMRGILMIG